MLDGVSKLAKLLASDELKTRKMGHKYVQELLRLKPGPDTYEISYQDVLGICKGLYYSLWMQDKPLLQEEIATRIVRLISTTTSIETRSMYTNAMFETLAREWDNLDVWRTDKFMMLTRDFLVRTLISTKKRKIPIETLVGAIFDKVLNANANSAVDLKIFLAMAVQQELLKLREFPTIFLGFFRRVVEVILAIPRGSVYATEMIKLLLFLTRTLRTFPSLPLNELSEELLITSTKKIDHRKTLRRISQMLHVRQKRADSKKGGSDENKMQPTRKRKMSSSPVNVEQTIDKLESRDTPLKRRKVEKNGTPVLSTMTAATIEEKKTPPESPQTPPPSTDAKRKRKRRRSSASSTPDGSVTKTESPEGVAVTSPWRIGNDSNNTAGIGEPEPISQAETMVPTKKQIGAIDLNHSDSSEPFGTSDGLLNTPVSKTTSRKAQRTNKSTGGEASDVSFDLSVLDTSTTLIKKRVSFGKVFRKKFSATKELVISPTVKPKPDRGILRL